MTKLNGYLGGIGGEKENKSQMISPGADARHIHIDGSGASHMGAFQFPVSVLLVVPNSSYILFGRYVTVTVS